MKISLRAQYRILKEIVTLLGLFEYVALGIGVYFIGAEELTNSIFFFIAMTVSYYTSTKLGYKVLELLVRLEQTR